MRGNTQRIDGLENHLKINKKGRGECPHPDCNSSDAFSFNRDTQLWICRSCGNKGNGITLSKILGLDPPQKGDEITIRAADLSLVAPQKIPDGKEELRRSRRYTDLKGYNMDRVETACAAMWTHPEAKPVLDYLHGRGFDDDTIKRFRLSPGRWRNYPRDNALCLEIPYLDCGKVRNTKKRWIAEDGEQPKAKYMIGKGAKGILFGASCIRGKKSVILCEGELDCVALHQMGFTESASIGDGAQSEPQKEWLEDLADAEEIFLLFDSDSAGLKGAKSLAESLGAARCKIVNLIPDRTYWGTDEDVSDVGDVLKKGCNPNLLRRLIEKAEPAGKESGMFASDLDLESILGRPDSMGVPTGIPELTEMNGGYRMGEVTIIPGHTGHGKSTFGLWTAWQMAEMGHGVWLSSLENGFEELVDDLGVLANGAPVCTPTGKLLDISTAKYRLGGMPVRIYAEVDEQRLEDLFVDFKRNKKKANLKFMMIDHLDFILAGQPNHIPKHEWIIDRMNKIKAFAAREKIHIFLIVHTKDIPSVVIPQRGDIAGSAKVTRIAQNAISVWRYDTIFNHDLREKVKVEFGAGNKHELWISPKETLISVWKIRKKRGTKTGAIILKYDPDRISYRFDRRVIADGDEL